jgi:hypothetical protein
MNAANILRHPAFGNAPVKNPIRRGPKKGTISLNVERGGNAPEQNCCGKLRRSGPLH